MNKNERMLSSTVDEIKRGYIDQENDYVCLLCGKSYEKGLIYHEDNTFYEAEKYMKLHIKKSHNCVFDYLIGMEKSVTGLSDHQSKLFKLFYDGSSDSKIKSELNIGSSSTIRNHRFAFREKERQAKIFLALMELLKESGKKTSDAVKPHNTAKMVDDRYKITEEERSKILEKCFPQGVNGPLRTFDIKEKNKLVVLRQIAKRFDKDEFYSEKEINEILKNVYEDFVTLRRYLIEYGFLDRKPDGSQYWLKVQNEKQEVVEMDRKKELKNLYKEMKIEAGVYQIRNTQNNKTFIVATPNLKTMNGRHIELKRGGHRNKLLQEDWNKYGEEAFVLEVLEVLEEPEEGFFDRKEELKKLEKKWLEKLQPFGEKGYH
ncbi:MAG: DUF2087 domain-containing protein [Bacillota bacterium]|nr:DUF2087 domain-containing protein [Bacillota bacterium]